jgi:hypothetical protein
MEGANECWKDVTLFSTLYFNFSITSVMHVEFKRGGHIGKLQECPAERHTLRKTERMNETDNCVRE